MNQTRSKSSLFLIELLIAIFFFSLAAAIGVKLFAISYVKAQASKNLNYAVSQSSSIAEVFEAENGDIEEISEMTGGISEDNQITLYYDEEWAECNESDAEFCIVLVITAEDNLAEADISVLEYSTKDEIYSISDKIYCPQKLSEEVVSDE